MADDEDEPQSEGLLAHARRIDRANVVRVVAILLGVTALIISALRFNDFFDSRADARAAAEAKVVAATKASATAVDSLLLNMESTVDDLAAGLTDGSIDDQLEERLSTAGPAGVAPDETVCVDPEAAPAHLEPALCVAAQEILELNGIGVVFAPSFDPEYLYRPYANRIDGPLALGELAFRDFETTDWYENAVAEGGAWTHPRFGETSLKLLGYYAAPFFTDRGEVRGVVLATYSLDRLAADVAWLSAGATGYSIILSDQGRVISHPSAPLVEREVTDSERLGDDLRSSASVTVADFRAELAAAGGESGFVTGVTDDVTESSAWFSWTPVETTGWTYGAIIVEREVLWRTAEQNRLLIDAGLALLAGILFLAVWVFGAYRGGDRSLWALSITAGVLAVIGVGGVWFLTLTGPADDLTQTSDVALSEVASYTGSPELPIGERGDAQPLFAGVFVQSVEFTGANDVTVSGIVWQEQRLGADGAEPPGFVFPEADEISIEEEYRSTDGDLTRVGWSFTASLRQTFDYSRYPLDRETVWLRLWPADYSRSFAMLPQLTSYETLAPSAKPGIERDFVVEGWALESSSFSYRDNSYNTDFALRNVAHDATPEMYFNVHLKRSFLDAAMSQLVPLSVVAILLFSVLLITTRRHTGRDDDALDFSSLGVLGYCAALFFVVILSHEQLRSKLNPGEIIYLEYFYFSTYLAILVVSANAILVGAGRGGRFVAYRDNLLPSLLYWPALNGAILAITVITFY